MHVFQIELTALKRFYLEIRFDYILLKVGKYDKVQLSDFCLSICTTFYDLLLVLEISDRR